MIHLPRLLPAVLLAVTVAACVPTVTRPGDCSDATAMRDVRLADDRLDPSAIEVCRDQSVTLSITAEQAAVLHVHGYDDQSVVRQFAAGERAEITFSAVRAGQFPIELHLADGTDVEAGLLTVHEP